MAQPQDPLPAPDVANGCFKSVGFLAAGGPFLSLCIFTGNVGVLALLISSVLLLAGSFYFVQSAIQGVRRRPVPGGTAILLVMSLFLWAFTLVFLFLLFQLTHLFHGMH